MKKVRGILIKTEREIDIMREAGRIVSKILDEIGAKVKPGIKTIEFENLALELCSKFKVKPAFKGLYGFPFSLCCSINEEVVHGFPSQRVLEDGDIVSFDFGVLYNGFYGDSARTFSVGQISETAAHLLTTTEESLYKGIEQALVGNDLYDIARAVQVHVEKQNLAVVKQFVGHGIGSKLHEPPEVPNFVPAYADRLALKAGFVLAIEPMITVGSEKIEILNDNWTAVTKDRSLAAHFEHTVAITSSGPRILTLSD